MSLVRRSALFAALLAAPAARAQEPAAQAPDVAAAVERGLAWLAAHQDADGKWDADRFMQHDVHGAPSDGPGRAVHDIGVTGLALLAFLAHGHTLRGPPGPYPDVLKKGVSWLRDQQDRGGMFGSNISHDFVYDHTLAALAMVEAYGRSSYELLRKNAQAGIDYLEAHRHPGGVWRYQPRDGTGDTSVTTWALLAYDAAEEHGLETNAKALARVARWYDEVTDPKTGLAGYRRRGELAARRPAQLRRFPREHTLAMTAAALYGRFLLGQKPADGPVMLLAAEKLLHRPPLWNEPAGTVDVVYWFFATRAMARMGEPYRAEWSKRLHGEVLARQRTDGNFGGSWDPVGAWGEDGGRVYATALMLLALAAAQG